MAGKAKLKRLSKERLIAAKDIRTEEVDVPEWDGSLLLRGMTVTERRNCRSLAREANESGDVQVDDLKMSMLTICMCCVEPKLELEDVSYFEEKSSGVVQRLFNKILELSCFSEPQGKKVDTTPNKPSAVTGQPAVSEGDFTPPQ